MSVEYYVEKFCSLNMNRQNGHKSPHKVCLLLAVMELIQAGHIHSNRIELNDPLKERFTHFFQRLRQGNDSDTPELPFFHLHSEGFWHLAYNEGIDPQTVKGYSKKGISHAYVDDELFQYMKSAIVSNDLKAALTENLSDLSGRFVQWLQNTGKSEKTARNYLQALNNSIPNWMAEHGLISEPLTEIKNYSKVNELKDQARKLENFRLFDRRGNGMYSAAINSYQRFLADITQVDVTTDLQQIWEDKTLKETEKKILSNARMGQGMFRDQLISMWQGCSVTGYKDAQLLVASHIKPWKASDDRERLDKFNGLLLLANLDKAFDLGIISFGDSGRLMISSQLEKPDVLGIKEEMTLMMQQEHRRYLDYHREKLFRAG